MAITKKGMVEGRQRSEKLESVEKSKTSTRVWWTMNVAKRST